jgi:hypothetical protein
MPVISETISSTRLRHVLTAIGYILISPEKEAIPYYGAVFESVRPLVDSVSWYSNRILSKFGHILLRRDKKKYDYYEFKVKIGDKVEFSRFFIYRHPLEVFKPER